MTKMIRAIFPIFILILSSCSNRLSDFDSDLKNEDWSCNSKAQIEESTFTDCLKLYKNQVPDSWWTLENLVDTIHGVVSFDTTNSEMYRQGISVTTLDIGDIKFKQYVENEHRIYTSREKLDLHEYGVSKINSEDSYWFVFESQDIDTLHLVNYCLYVEKEDAGTCFLLRAFVNKEKNWRQRLCLLKKYLHTFEKL
jgi:hypothetical protein